MKFNIYDSVEHILILGAGSSVEYGLPVWKDLGVRIKERLENQGDKYQYKKQILNWIDKIGEGKTYKTIDECIYYEAVSPESHLDGVDVENELFSIVKEIFIDSYHNESGGWIRKLNEKILNIESTYLEKHLAFINYNYDNVLDDNFLNYDYLAAKHRRLNYKARLESLSGIPAQALCPHGTLFPHDFINHSHLHKFYETIKTGEDSLLDVVSCYDSKEHSVNAHFSSARKLYILGLGGGLEINLDNLEFKFPISEVHVTIRDKNLHDRIVNYLAGKFGLLPDEIKVYDSCVDLINKSF